jgi:hypothetical protein
MIPMRTAFTALIVIGAGGILVAGDAPPVPPITQEQPKLPAGVTRVTLPPGIVTLEYVAVKEPAKGRPTLRLTVGKTVLQGERIYLGDGKVAQLFEATEEGIHWALTTGKKGFVENTHIWHPGSGIDLGKDYWTVNGLKPGSVYVTTPSIKFEYEELKGEPKP